MSDIKLQAMTKCLVFALMFSVAVAIRRQLEHADHEDLDHDLIQFFSKSPSASVPSHHDEDHYAVVPSADSHHSDDETPLIFNPFFVDRNAISPFNLLHQRGILQHHDILQQHKHLQQDAMEDPPVKPRRPPPVYRSFHFINPKPHTTPAPTTEPYPDFYDLF